MTNEEKAKENGITSGKGSQTLSRAIDWVKSKFNND